MQKNQKIEVRGMLNVMTISVQNDKLLREHCILQMREESESGIRKWEKMWLKMTAEDREGAAVTCDGRLFHRRAAATGNALSPTVDRRVRRTSSDVDKAERSRRLDWVSAGRRSLPHRCHYNQNAALSQSRAQNPLQTFPRNFQPVTDLLRGSWCNGFWP